MTVSMSAVWDRTSEFLSDNLAAVAGIAALTIFVPGAIGDSLAPLKTTGGDGVKLLLGALTLVFGILSLWGQLAIVAMALDPALDAAGGRARATRRLGAMILLLIVLMVAALVLALPVLAALIANHVDLTQLGQPGAQASLGVGWSGLIALYVVVMVPLLLWLLARFVVLATPVVVAEDGSVGALGRAFRLSRGLTWKIIGVLLLYGILMFVATLAAVTVFGGILALIVKSPEPISIATVLTAIVSALVSTVFTVIGAVFPAKLYLAARAREGAAAA